MSFDVMSETEQSTIAELYVIQYGSRVSYYTSYSRNIEFMGNQYRAGSIKRSGMRMDVKYASVKMQVSTPATEDMLRYIPQYPIEPMTITIYRAEVADTTNYKLFFRGKVIAVRAKDLVVTVQVESKNKILSRKVPRIVYQSFCNHDLFDSGCKLIAANYARDAIVIDQDPQRQILTVEFTDGKDDPPDVGYFQGGTIVLGEDMRFIVSNNSIATVGLQIPFDFRQQIGSEVVLYPGCDGNPNTCMDVFSNWRHFLGMPTIPFSNPVLWGLR